MYTIKVMLYCIVAEHVDGLCHKQYKSTIKTRKLRHTCLLIKTQHSDTKL